jgi:threonine dehydrogenase-like Zn-dependent dehydrogenase
MKALVYHGPGRKALEQRPKPELQSPTDAIVRVTRTTICGTDLHILKGDVPTCEPGRILGHEGVGIVEQVGVAVDSLKPGDHVLISCISSCGRCEYCRRGLYSHCTTGGWILGHRIDGTQAEYVRIPHASTSLYRIPPGVDEDALVMLSDILPTGFECGVLNGKVQPGCSVAIVGVHGVKADLHLEKLWDRNISITTRLVDTVSTPMLLKTVRAGRLDPKRLITHRFSLDDVERAYDTFGRAAQTHALKVIIEVS